MNKSSFIRPLLLSFTLSLSLGSIAQAAKTPNTLPEQPIYDLRLAINLNGNDMINPTVITKNGETATVIHEANGEKIVVEVAAIDASEKAKNVVNLKFTLKRIDIHGNESVLGRPQISALINEEAMISTTENNGESYTVKVTARKL